MPEVPVSPIATVQPEAPRPVYQQGADSTLPFGGATGAGLSAVGQATEQTGAEAGKIAADLGIQADMRATKDASTQSMLYANNLGFKGDGSADNPSGFFAMRGQQALDYAPKYLAAIQAQADQTSQGMTDRQRSMYQNTMDTHIVSQQGAAQRFVMQQNEEANLATSNARLSAATGTAMSSYNDPVTISDNAKIVRGEIVSQNPGASPEVLAAKTSTALGKYYGDLVDTALARGDVTTGVGLFNMHQGEMDPVSRVQQATKLLVPMQNARANAQANRYLGDNTTIGDGTVIQPGDRSMPRGLRNNNPLNLEYRDGQGATNSDGRFGVYPTMEAGVAANAKQLVAYQDNHGLNTINGIIGRWSPVSDPTNAAGSTSAYAASVAKSMGVGGDDKIDLHDQGTLGSLITSMAKVENGGKVPPADVVAKGVAGAFGAPLPSAVEQASSPQNVAAVAAATQVHPDFGAAKEQALKDYGDDAEMLPKVLAAISRREGAFNLGVKTQQEALKKTLPDLQAALSDGRDDTPIPEIAIRHAFDGPTADSVMNQLNEAREFGQVYKTTQTMTPDQYSQARSQLVASMSGTALPAKDGKTVTPVDGSTPSPDAGITGYAQRQKELVHLDAAYAKAQTALKTDPASYVRSSAFPDVGTAFTAGNDPVSTAAAIQKSMDTQRSLFADPTMQPRAISNASAAKLASQLNTTTPDKGDLGSALDAMQKQYGPAWPAVWRDVVRAGASPSFQALAAMDMPEQATARGDLQRALQDKAVKGDDFGKSIDPIQKSAAEQQIQSNVLKLRGVLPAYNSNSTFDSVIMPSIQTLATHYMTQGMDGATAADKAYQGVIGAKYDIDDKLMVPKSVGIDKVRAAGDSLTSGLKDEDLQGTTAAEARRGTWATLPDGSGAGLLKQTLQGGLMPIRRSDGSYVTLPFKGLPEPGLAAKSAAADTGITPGMN